ncbi:hypothetical protein BLD25_00650 [Candidatus Gracilibacteria bacterium GN02-872]|nr:hypothetical protein BLD25_00650 [Candidatus Gracilibacteria bacterium GN02-872]
MDREKFLMDLKKYGEQNEIPNISLVNARFLRDLIIISKTKNMLEIGTANGFSTINFAIELEKVGGKITTIEFSENSFNVAKKNFAEAGVSSIINQIWGNALDEVPKLENESFDFIFIDGMKRRSVDFLKLCLPKLKKGGILLIDDVIKFKEKMTGLYEFLEESKIIFNVIPIDGDDGIMMILKS